MWQKHHRVNGCRFQAQTIARIQRAGKGLEALDLVRAGVGHFSTIVLDPSARLVPKTSKIPSFSTDSD
jgi:hypothetical protein